MLPHVNVPVKLASAAISSTASSAGLGAPVRRVRIVALGRLQGVSKRPPWNVAMEVEAVRGNVLRSEREPPPRLYGSRRLVAVNHAEARVPWLRTRRNQIAGGVEWQILDGGIGRARDCDGRVPASNVRLVEHVKGVQTERKPPRLAKAEVALQSEIELLEEAAAQDRNRARVRPAAEMDLRHLPWSVGAGGSRIGARETRDVL